MLFFLSPPPFLYLISPLSSASLNQWLFFPPWLLSPLMGAISRKTLLYLKGMSDKFELFLLEKRQRGRRVLSAILSHSPTHPYESRRSVVTKDTVQTAETLYQCSLKGRREKNLAWKRHPQLFVCVAAWNWCTTYSHLFTIKNFCFCGINPFYFQQNRKDYWHP